MPRFKKVSKTGVFGMNENDPINMVKTEKFDNSKNPLKFQHTFFFEFFRNPEWRLHFFCRCLFFFFVNLVQFISGILFGWAL